VAYLRFNKTIVALILVFILGWVLNDFYSVYTTNFNLKPLQKENFGKYFLINVLGQEPLERISPSDIIKESQIDVNKDLVTIKIEDGELASFANTNSMDPVLDETANAVGIKPKTENDLKIGDIISYYSKEKKVILVHRVIGIGFDNDGKYFILKGDNNTEADPEKVRFSQIQRKIAIIIY